MTKFQNYKHYKLPITINPLNYGKLILRLEKIFVIQVNRTNIALINQEDKLNNVKLFKEGDLMLEYKDILINDSTFIRILDNTKFTFKNNNLNFVSIEKSIKRTIIIILIFISLQFIDNYIYSQLAAIPITNIIKLRRVASKYSWKDLVFNIKNKVFTKILFESKFNTFWEKIEQEFSGNNHMFILFKVKYIGSDYVTIGKLQRLNFSDKDWYLNWIINNMILKSEYYNETPIVSFLFSYGFKNEKLSEKETINFKVNFQKYENNKLVISYNPLDYGKLILKNEFKDYTQFILQTRENLVVKINKFEEYNEVELVLGGESILKFRDDWISENKFIRTLDNKKFYFENNKEILFTKEIKTKFILKQSTIKNLTNKFITLDIETFIKDNILVVYCISIFDGKRKNSFFLNDYKNVDDLIITALKSIMTRKYNGYNVYVHNLAKFDIIFLLKYLVKLGSIEPIIHNERIILIKFKFGKYQLQFKDSYLLLLASLMKLCKSFGVNNPKSIFPISL